MSNEFIKYIWTIAKSVNTKQNKFNPYKLDDITPFTN
jgi:hypothetical protein